MSEPCSLLNLCCGGGNVDDTCPDICNTDTADCPTTYCTATKITTLTISAPTPMVGANDGLIASAASPVTADFGSQPAGLYYLVYCSGGYDQYDPGCPDEDPMPQECTALQSPPATPPPTYQSAYNAWTLGNNSSGDILIGTLTWIDICSFDTTSAQWFTGLGDDTSGSLAALETFYAGQSMYFEHGGGDISLSVVDNATPTWDFNPTTNVTSGPPTNPTVSGSVTVSLYKLAFPNPDVNIWIDRACAAWTTPGSAANVSIYVHNGNCNCWGDVTVTLENTGGISGASGPLTSQDLPYHSDQVFFFTFNCTSVGITATITLSSSQWASPITLSVYLAPIIVLTINGVGNNACGPNVHFDFVNNGNWQVSPTALTISLTNAYLFITNIFVCAGTSSKVYTSPPLLDCLGSGEVADELVRGSPTDTTATCVFVEGGYTYPTVSGSATGL